MNYKGELIKILKNRLFLILIVITTLIYIIQVNWVFNNMFLAEYKVLANIADNMNCDIRKLISSDTISSINDYGHIACLKTCFLYPIYLLGKTFILLLIIVTCIDCYYDEKYKRHKLMLVYNRKHKYFFARAVAMASVFTAMFLILGIISVVEVLILQLTQKSDLGISNTIDYISASCSWWNIVVFILTLVIVFIVSISFSFAIYSLAYVTEVPFTGLITILAAIPSASSSWPFMYVNAIAYIYKCLLPYDSMCLYSNTLEFGSFEWAQLVCFYVWGGLLFAIAYLPLHMQKYKMEQSVND